MPLFDTHGHYNLEPFYDPAHPQSWRSHWQRAQAAGVQQSLVIGTTIETSRLAIEIAEQDPALFCSVGVHPHEFGGEATLHDAGTIGDEQLLPQDLAALKKNLLALSSHPKVRAIGEVGLDYFRLPTETTAAQLTKTAPQAALSIKEAQLAGLRIQLEVAAERGLPVILHVRDQGEEAYWAVLALLKEFSQVRPFVLHCASGPAAYIKEATQLGGYVSFAGNVTYRNAAHLRELARLVPADRLLLETDAPFLPPQPHRGQTCEPWMIGVTAAFVAEELGASLDQIWENSQRCFGVPAQGASR